MSGVHSPVEAAPTGAGDVLDRRFRRTARATRAFFQANDEAVARACLEMARRFESGGRLWVLGDGAQASDARHVAVEFVHPVIVGKRALPAVALVPGAVPAAASTGGPHELAALARPGDIVMAISGPPETSPARDALDRAPPGCLTLALSGPRSPGDAADFVFAVENEDPMVVQEVLETLYHVLWELVHVFFERRVVG